MMCRVDNCLRSHRDDQVCCAHHWFRLPKPIRDEIWRLFREQEGSEDHVKAVYAAIGSLNRA
jgi:hypothetical protein